MVTDNRSSVGQDLAAALEAFQALPLVHEDDQEVEMGESNLHWVIEAILRFSLAAHLAGQPRYRVYANLNFHFQPRFPRVYVTPDVMVVTPAAPLAEDVNSYALDRDGPAPVLVAEILSERTAEERDLEEKPQTYAFLGIPEYVLIDPSGEFLEQRLLLKRLQRNRTWKDEQDADGGITSRLGCRVVLEADGKPRVLDVKTGERYPRPDEAVARVRELEKELARLRGKGRKGKGS
jgi:Uma2 family endonuclease